MYAVELPINSMKGPGFYGSGAEGIRTPDPLNANQMLSQLSYSPR